MIKNVNRNVQIKLNANKRIKKIKQETVDYKKKLLETNQIKRRPLSAILFKRK
jgi:hypothetical protein